MGQGQEFLHRLNQVLNAFEEAVVKREHKKLLDSKVSLRQNVGTARQHVIDEVVKIVTEARMAEGASTE